MCIDFSLFLIFSSIDSGLHSFEILGSIIPSDYSVLFEGLKQFYPKGKDSLKEKNHRIIIVPHEIIPRNLNDLETLLLAANFQWTYYTEKYELNKSRVVVINKVGILPDLYLYSDLAYIGGGFGAGIHNILESASFDVPVVFGPNYQKFNEAKELIKLGGAISITTIEELTAALIYFINNYKTELAQCQKLT